MRSLRKPSGISATERPSLGHGQSGEVSQVNGRANRSRPLCLLLLADEMDRKEPLLLLLLLLLRIGILTVFRR